MSFSSFLIESIEFVGVDAEQLATLRQEINKNDVVDHIKKDYLDKQTTPTKIVDSDFYIDGLGMDVKGKVVLKASFVAEVTEDDGYVYFKKVEFTYNAETNTLLSINDIDRYRSDDWKVIQGEILKTGSKI